MMLTVRDAWERVWRAQPPEVLAGPLTSPLRAVPADKTYDLFGVLFPGLVPSLRTRRARDRNVELTSDDIRAFREATVGHAVVLARASRLASALLTLVEEHRSHPTIASRTNSRSKAGPRAEAAALTKYVLESGLPLSDDVDPEQLRPWVRSFYGLDADLDPETVPLRYPALQSWAALPAVRERFQHEVDRTWARAGRESGDVVTELPVLLADPFARDQGAGEAELMRQLKAAAEILGGANADSLERILTLRALAEDPDHQAAPPRFTHAAPQRTGAVRALDQTIVERLNGPLTRRHEGIAASRIDDLVRWEIGEACSVLGLSRPRDRELLVVGSSIAQSPIDLERTVDPAIPTPFAGSGLHRLHRHISRTFFGKDLRPWDLPLAARKMLDYPLPTLASALWNRLHNNAAINSDESAWQTFRRTFASWLGTYATISSTAMARSRRADPPPADDRNLAESSDRPGAPPLIPTVVLALEHVATASADGSSLIRAFMDALAKAPAEAGRSVAWQQLEARARELDPAYQKAFTPSAVIDAVRGLMREHTMKARADEKG